MLYEYELDRPSKPRNQRTNSYASKAQAPRVPGISNNQAVLGTSAEVYYNPTPQQRAAGGSGGGGGGTGGGVTEQIPAGQRQATTNMAHNTDIARQLNERIGGIKYPDRPEMRSGQSMAELLGILYDRGTFEEIMGDAVKAQFANLDTEYGRTQADMNRHMASNTDMLLGTMRRGDRGAAMTGATRGSQMASELGALLAASDDHAQVATGVAQERGDLVHQREAALAGVPVDALKMYNDLGLNLGQLSASELGHNAVMYSGEYASLAGLEAALRQQLSQDYNHATGLQNNLDVAHVQGAAQRAAAAAGSRAYDGYGTAESGSGNREVLSHYASALAEARAQGDEGAIKFYNDMMNQEMAGKGTGVFVPYSPPSGGGDTKSSPKPPSNFSNWLDGQGDFRSFLPRTGTPSYWSGR